ncbi:hypothetical protein PC120_g3677 [Phytophthora cactorum]|nr:hypothetical protein PC120_g3677 [Phytophthora cactorum]
MASRKRKYASIEEIEETHQLFDEEESAGDRKRRKNRLNSALYRFRQRSARVDGNVHVRGSSGPPRSLIEQLLSPEVAPSADTAPVCVTETSHDPSADHVVQQALLARRTFRDSVTSTKLNKLAGGAQPCPLRRKNRDRARRIDTERQRARRAQQSERERDRAGQEERRAGQTQEEREARQERDRLYHGRLLQEETPEQREARQGRNRLSHQESRAVVPSEVCTAITAVIYVYKGSDKAVIVVEVVRGEGNQTQIEPNEIL